MNFQDRFWQKVKKTDACWEWNAATNKFGYGVVKWRRECTGAHRVSYELTVGPIPAGVCVLHRCDNPPCVNPKHLFLGSRTDNVLDMTMKKRGRNGRSDWTHCVHGHAFTAENTRVTTQNGKLWRECRKCCANRQRERRNLKKQRPIFGGRCNR